MKIYNPQTKVYIAVDSMVGDGIVGIEGTKTIALNYLNRLKECLKPYKEIEAHIGFHEATDYLYYLYDLNRLTYQESKELFEQKMREVDGI